MNKTMRAYQSKEATGIDPNAVWMRKGLPTLWHVPDGSYRGKYVGSYAEMNSGGQMDRDSMTWTKDPTLSDERARQSFWDSYGYHVVGDIKDRCGRHENLGSRGLLEVWLDLSHLNSRR